jgi:hypothetical protein
MTIDPALFPRTIEYLPGYYQGKQTIKVGLISKDKIDYREGKKRTREGEIIYMLPEASRWGAGQIWASFPLTATASSSVTPTNNYYSFHGSIGTFATSLHSILKPVRRLLAW